MNLTSLITAPARLALSLGGRVAGLAKGRLGGGPAIDDDTLQRRVEADLFGSRKVAKTKVQIEVNDGVVWLRGEVKSDAVAEEAESRAGAIEGVQRVENLLRVAKAESRSRPKARTSQRTQKRPAPKRSSRPKPPAATAPAPDVEPAKPAPPPPAAQQEREVTRRFNAEETPAGAEPSPRELAETAKGRQPAPLGATGTGSGDSPPAPFPSVANGSNGTNGDSA
jgi:hypothetical protein